MNKQGEIKYAPEFGEKKRENKVSGIISGQISRFKRSSFVNDENKGALWRILLSNFKLRVKKIYEVVSGRKKKIFLSKKNCVVIFYVENIWIFLGAFSQKFSRNLEQSRRKLRYGHS